MHPKSRVWEEHFGETRRTEAKRNVLSFHLFRFCLMAPFPPSGSSRFLSPSSLVALLFCSYIKEPREALRPPPCSRASFVLSVDDQLFLLSLGNGFVSESHKWDRGNILLGLHSSPQRIGHFLSRLTMDMTRVSTTGQGSCSLYTRLGPSLCHRLPHLTLFHPQPRPHASYVWIHVRACLCLCICCWFEDSIFLGCQVNGQSP